MKQIRTLLLGIVIVAILIFAIVRVLSESDKKRINMFETNEDLLVVDDTKERSDIEKRIKVPAICQYPELPTGCESVAAAMVLQYYGDSVSAEKFASAWLECNNDFYSAKGKDYGPDPNEVFVGDPFSLYSYGCFAGPIANAINRNSTKCSAQIITGRSLEQLCKDYIVHEKPLLIWATMEMKESYEGRSWYLQNGSKFTWIAGEHCLVLVGYDSTHYYLNDPMTGSTVSYEKSLVEERFSELGKQAVLMLKN